MNFVPVRDAAPTAERRPPRAAAVRAILACALLPALALAGCKGCGAATPASDPNEIVVGEYGSMTGSEATFGQSTHNGITLAAEEINAAGGIQVGRKKKKLRLVSYDDQGKTSEVGTAVTRLITSDGVLAVLGEVSSSLSIAGGQICQQHGVPMITPSSTNPRVTEVGDYVFRICFTDVFQGYVMARFLTNPAGKDGLGLRTVAMLVDQRQAYSQGLSRYFQQALEKLGGKVVATERYQGGDQDFSAQLTRLKEAAPQAIYIPGYYTDVANIARQARAMGITVPLLGGDGWESVTDIGGKALDGAYYSNHYAPEDRSPVVRAFTAKYKAKYGETPDSMAALGYDATMLLKDAIERAAKAGPLTRKTLRDAIAGTRGFQGVTGTITIDAHRNARKPAVVLQIHAADKTAVFKAAIPAQ